MSTSTSLPIADTPAVRRYAATIARRNPRLLCTALSLHVLAAVAALAAPRLLGDLVEAVETGTTTSYVDKVVLVLVEPTSAVDAHTEARIASRLRAQRAGRTTVVMSSSPLVLDAVDEVAFVQSGRVVATGTHAELLRSVPAYRAVVTREQDPATEEVPS